MNVGDAWSCTNPSLGRGVSIGLMHAVALRDFLHEEAGSEPWQAAAGWAEVTRQEVEPYVRSTLRYDRLRLQQIKAIIDGRPFHTDDVAWRLQTSLEAAALTDSDTLRAMVETAMLLRTPEEILEDGAFSERVLNQAAPYLEGSSLDVSLFSPSREQLLATLA